MQDFISISVLTSRFWNVRDLFLNLYPLEDNSLKMCLQYWCIHWIDRGREIKGILRKRVVDLRVNLKEYCMCICTYFVNSPGIWIPQFSPPELFHVPFVFLLLFSLSCLSLPFLLCPSPLLFADMCFGNVHYYSSIRPKQNIIRKRDQRCTLQYISRRAIWVIPE